MSSGRLGTERERVALLHEIFSAGLSSSTRNALVGIGDDCAVLAAPAGAESLVWSIDAQVEGVHFDRRWMGLADIGYRATMAALSDLAAMGARPMNVLCALELPRGFTDDELRELAEGQREAADEAETFVVGGNLSRSPHLALTTTVLGACLRPLLRSGAAQGERVWLAGRPGLAGAGLELHRLAVAPGSDDERAADLAFRRPRALLAEGVAAASAGASAMIDVSDGLSIDMTEMAKKSGVAIVLDLPALVDERLSRLASSLIGAAAGTERATALALALGGGEDYALVATAPHDVELVGFRSIGLTTADLAPGLWGNDGDGKPHPIEPRGFDHFG